MAATTEEPRVQLKNPNTGRDDLRILRSIHRPVRRAMLDALVEMGELSNGGLRSEVESRTPPELWRSNSLGWYTTSIKLDLEARGLLTAIGRPQRLVITEAGRVAWSQAD